MTARLTKLEQLNSALRLEVKEKLVQIRSLENENEALKLASSASTVDQVKKLRAERDKYKK